jgi:hypothetical protein
MRAGDEMQWRVGGGRRGRFPDENGRPVVTVLVAAAVALTVLVLAGCGGDRAARPRSTATTDRVSPTAPGPSPLHAWIAVFQTAKDPNQLDAAAEELMDRVGPAVVVAPEGCFRVLRGRGDIGPGDYVLAVMAGSEDQLERAVERAGEEPMVTARVEDLCPE